jgi:serine/threonine protein kinase
VLAGARLPELIRLIGRGSYGEVWLARQTDQSLCAVKIVRRQSFNDDRPYEREFLGVQKFAPLSQTYDSQLRILQVGRDDREEYFFYLMELADDEQTGREIDPETYVPRTLRGGRQRRSRLPLEDCIAVGISLSAALENLHQNGLIHRDIKPSNVVFVEGVPKLADIGLVTDSDVTVSFVGTEGFVPPEGPGSAQADIYSLGKVLYEISTGQDRQAFPGLPTSVADSPDSRRFLELNAIIAKCCHGDPRRRYASARQLYADLDVLRRGRSVRLKRAVRRNTVVALWTAVIGLACFGVVGLLFKFGRAEIPLLFRTAKSTQAQPAPTSGEAVQSEVHVSLPARSPAATPNQLELTAFYNAQLDSAWHTPNEPRLTLAKFPAGLVRLGNTLFDARGIIQLSSSQMERRHLAFPKQVTGITAGLKAHRFHFLHGTVWPEKEGAHLGDYVVHYADGQQHVFPIVYGVDLRDWNVGSDTKTETARGTVVWSAWQQPFAFRVFKTSWTNPVPQVEITGLDVISRMETSAPFVIAITIE